MPGGRVKLIIQIPAYNEEATLPQVLAALPRTIPGIERVEWLVVDDGSTDDTAGAARRGGADHVVRHSTNLGLARAFMRGVEECLRRGADVIVNLDGDNQYDAACIPALVQPILDGRAEIVVGARPIDAIGHFSPLKKMLSKLGSAVIRHLSGANIPDAPSGFRAFSREAALQLNVFSQYTYTLETIIQAGRKGIPILSVPIRVNGPTRPSRLSRGAFDYMLRSIGTIVRIFVVYRPMRFFVTLGSIPFAAGCLIGLRFLGRYLSGHGQGMVQSLILAAVFLLSGCFLFVIAFVADVIAANRVLLENANLRLRRLEQGRRDAHPR